MRLRTFILASAALALSFACGKTPEPEPKPEPKPTTVPVTSVSLNKSNLTLEPGGSETLTATVAPSNATDKTVTWSTSNSGVATVESGKVTAIKEGEATITAKAGGKEASCKVTVKKAVIAVESVTLNKTELTLEPGATETLIATVAPENATDKTVTWSTSNAEIATVENGKVTGVKEGEATITAQAGGKEASCKVTVKPGIVPVESITLDKSELSLNKGDSFTLTAVVKPDNATDKTVTWTSTDGAIAYVTQEGKVMALSGGDAVVTATAGEVSATCVVTVTVPVQSVSLDVTSMTLKPGAESSLLVTILPEDATNRKVTWTNTNPSVATIDELDNITALAVGTTVLTATVENKSASCTVIVAEDKIAVESITLNKTELTLEPDATETLIATVLPENATDKTVAWSTSNPEIAIVEDGVVTAMNEGEAVITAKAGEKEATCKVVVEGPPSISVSVSAMTFLSNGGTKELTVSCRGDWTLSGYPSWCVPSMTSGIGDATIVLTVSKNTEQQRSAQLSFSCSGEVVSVLITQTGEGWQNQRFVHKSLYMMFTSVHCGWSLYMNQNIQKADPKVGDKYVRVDVHGRGISNPLPESPIDFSEAHVLYGLFYAGIPSGVLDSRVRVRNWSDRDAHLVPETFVSAIKQQEEVYPAGTGIAFSSSLSGNVLKVEGKVYSHIAESMKLTVYLLEDAIQGESLGYDGYYSDRQYDNVLRLTLSDVMGDSIYFENKNSVKDFKYSITIPEGYNRDNLSILVFVQREYGNVIVRDEYMGDYYIDNCRKANVGMEAKLELYENSSGGGNEGIGIGDEITF